MVQALRYENPLAEKQSKLTEFLFSRAAKDRVLTNFVYWHLIVECSVPKNSAVFQKKLDDFKKFMEETSQDSRVGVEKPMELIKRQEEFLKDLTDCYHEIKAMKLSSAVAMV